MNMFSDHAHDDSMLLNLPIIFRQATVRDIQLMEWHGEFKHYRRLFERAYRDQLSGYKYLLVATLNDYPIGRIFVQFKGRRTMLADGMQRGYLYSLHVMSFLQGAGIGTRLISKAESILRDASYTIATIAVARENAGALRLYERLGYHIFAEDDGQWHYYDHRGRLHHVDEPAYLMAKRLTS